MCKFYFNCKTETAVRQQMSGWQWLYGTVGENRMKFPRCARSPSGTSLFGSLGWKQPLAASPRGHHLPANIWIPKSNDSHISVWYFLDWNCCTCAMWSVSSMFNTSQAAAGKCSVELVWDWLKGHFFLGFLQYPQPKRSLRSHGWKSSGNWRWHINVVIFVMLDVIELAKASLESRP